MQKKIKINNPLLNIILKHFIISILGIFITVFISISISLILNSMPQISESLTIYFCLSSISGVFLSSIIIGKIGKLKGIIAGVINSVLYNFLLFIICFLIAKSINTSVLFLMLANMFASIIAGVIGANLKRRK